jgi:Uma2 family endonuclease
MSAANLHRLMTVAEFLAWNPPDGSDRWELVDGVPVAMAPASDRHALIHAEAARLIGNHLAEHRPDCRVLIEPGAKLDEQNLRIPDLSVICGPIDPAARFSTPVLIVEILSPSNWRKTMNNVARYASLEGLAEVLILHSTRMLAQVFRRGTFGAWDDIASFTSGDEVVTLESIGFTAPLAAFYRTVLGPTR